MSANHARTQAAPAADAASRVAAAGSARRRSAQAATIVLLAALFGLDCAWLLQRPRVGVADNGDFWRVARPAGIDVGAAPERLGRAVVPRYRATERVRLPEGATTPSLVAWLASSTRDDQGWIDLRAMGAVYLALFASMTAAALLGGVDAWLVLALVFVLSDSGYLLFLDSFYADPPLLLALVALLWWLEWLGRESYASRELSARRWAIWLGPGLVLFGGLTKMQYAVLPAIAAASLALWLLRGRAAPGTSSKPPIALLATFVMIAALAPAWFVWGPGPHFPDVNRYHAVYAGLAAVANDPNEALAELGIPPELRDLPRRDVFDAHLGPQHPVHEALREVSRVKLVLAYLARPHALARTGSIVGRELARARAHERGTTEEGAGPRRYVTRWWEHGRIRTFLFSRAPWLWWLLPAACFAGASLAAWSLPAHRQPSLALLFLPLWIAGQVAVVVAGDGLVNLRQHLIATRLGLDLLLAVLLVEGVRQLRRGLPSARERGRAEYGLLRP